MSVLFSPSLLPSERFISGYKRPMDLPSLFSVLLMLRIGFVFIAA